MEEKRRWREWVRQRARAGEMNKHSQSSSTRDDFNKLLGDDSLSGTVEFEGQLFNHLSWRE